MPYEEIKKKFQMNKDVVNHPSHYETGKFECIEVMEEALGRDTVIDFCLANAFKYLYRSKRKNGLEDIKKAQWYINRYIMLCEDGSGDELLYADGEVIMRRKTDD